MAATNAEVQAFSEECRNLCADIRAVVLAVQAHRARWGDVYANLTNSPNWTDSRSQDVPFLNTPSRLLAFNTFEANLVTFIADTNNQYAAVQEMCVNPAQVN